MTDPAEIEVKRQRTAAAREARKRLRELDVASVLDSIESFKALQFERNRPETLADALTQKQAVEPDVYALALVALALFVPWRVHAFVVECPPPSLWTETANGDAVSIWTGKAASDLRRLVDWSRDVRGNKSDKSESQAKVIRSVSISRHQRADRMKTQPSAESLATGFAQQLKIVVRNLPGLMGDL